MDEADDVLTERGAELAAVALGTTAAETIGERIRAAADRDEARAAEPEPEPAVQAGGAGSSPATRSYTTTEAPLSTPSGSGHDAREEALPHETSTRSAAAPDSRSEEDTSSDRDRAPAPEVPPFDPNTMTCPTCQGHGITLTGSLVERYMERDCLTCEGRGYVDALDRVEPRPQEGDRREVVYTSGGGWKWEG